MILFIILAILSILTSAFYGYLVVIHIGSNYFWIGFLFLIPNFYLYFGFFVSIIGIISLFLKNSYSPMKPNLFLYSLVRNVILVLLRIFNINVHITGKELIDKNKCSLIVSNHYSSFDPMFFIYELKKRPVVCLSKKQNLNIPIGGKYIRYTGFLALDRDDVREAITVINSASNIIENGYGHIFVAPEGTRNKTNNLLLPMHAGSFKIALKSKAPIIISCIRNSHEISKNFFFVKKDIYIDIIKVLEYEQIKDLNTNEIKDKCENLIKEHLIKHRK